ncbi:hypothetical protein AB1K54_14800 [Microbacterium sp. BWT-B31]|uniref:hypothetical protein n=1 Tax=Microbacterium sp. BWT-B31 TaxID=3232072 RepID=UPI003527B907
MGKDIAMSEQAILHDLVSSWVSLGLEFAAGAPGVSALYIYVSSERGSIFANVYYEQDGIVTFPDDLVGAKTSSERVGQLHDFQFEDLLRAERQFAEENVPAPTEYKIYYEPATRKLDVQLSRDLIYANDLDKIPERGIEYWLGDRAPKLF